jgi:hypothetical protein
MIVTAFGRRHQGLFMQSGPVDVASTDPIVELRDAMPLTSRDAGLSVL